jgi:hypothetical protein
MFRKKLAHSISIGTGNTIKIDDSRQVGTFFIFPHKIPKRFGIGTKRRFNLFNIVIIAFLGKELILGSKVRKNGVVKWDIVAL